MDFQEAYTKGSEALKENRLDEARTLLETALKLKPNDIYTMNKLAMVLKEQGDFTGAEALLAGCLEVKKEDLYTNYLLGNTYLEQGDVDKAIETLEKTVKMNPSDRYAVNSLALAYRMKRDYEKCIEIPKRVCRATRTICTTRSAWLPSCSKSAILQRLCVFRKRFSNASPTMFRR